MIVTSINSFISIDIGTYYLGLQSQLRRSGAKQRQAQGTTISNKFILQGLEFCQEYIEAHNCCMRKMGFKTAKYQTK